MLWDGNECGKNKSNENFKTTIPSKIYDRPKTTTECGIFKYLGSVLTNDGKYTCEIKSRIAMAKAVFNKKRVRFISTPDLKLRKKLVKCYIWSIALYGAETWTIRAVDQKYLEGLKCGDGERWRRSVGPIM